MTLETNAVVAIVNNKDRILMGKKKKQVGNPLSGQWHIPGEKVQSGESDETALKRGIKEEAGIEIKVLKYLATRQTENLSEIRWYKCEAKTYNIQAGSDLSEVKWVPKHKVTTLCNYRAFNLWPKEIQKYFDLSTLKG